MSSTIEEQLKDVVDQQTIEVIKDFILTGEYFLPKLTLHLYKFVLVNLFLTTSKNLDQLNSEFVSEWLNNYRIGKNGLAVKKTLSILARFFEYCKARGYIGTLPINHNRSNTKVDIVTPLTSNRFRHSFYNGVDSIADPI